MGSVTWEFVFWYLSDNGFEDYLGIYDLNNLA